jgi:hypothetical protein
VMTSQLSICNIRHVSHLGYDTVSAFDLYREDCGRIFLRNFEALNFTQRIFQNLLSPVIFRVTFPIAEFLATDPEVRVRSPSLPHFLRSSGSGTGSTRPREYN